jgi:hypothetical protein
MKKCPYCAEEIQDEAVVCRFCGRDLAGQSPDVNMENDGPESRQRRMLSPLAQCYLIAAERGRTTEDEPP